MYKIHNHCNIAGFYFGVILLIIVALFTDYGVRNLVASGIKRHRQDYELICEWAFGKSGYYCITVFMFIMAYGGMVAYHVVIGDTVPHVIDYYFQNGVHHGMIDGLLLLHLVFVLCYHYH